MEVGMSRKIIQVINVNEYSTVKNVLASDGTIWKLSLNEVTPKWEQIDLPALPVNPITVEQQRVALWMQDAAIGIEDRRLLDTCIHCGRVFSLIEKELGECAKCDKQI